MWKQLISLMHTTSVCNTVSYVWIALIPRFLKMMRQVSYITAIPLLFCHLPIAVSTHAYTAWFIKESNPQRLLGRVHHHLISVITVSITLFNSRGWALLMVYTQQAQRYSGSRIHGLSHTPSHAQPWECFKVNAKHHFISLAYTSLYVCIFNTVGPFVFFQQPQYRHHISKINGDSIIQSSP